MAKVITLSRAFPAYHPKKGEPTYFVEKIYNSLDRSMHKGEVFLIAANSQQLEDNKFCTGLLAKFYQSLFPIEEGYKHHTIRAGKRWKTGDMASVRVWSGKPYNSPQIIIYPDVELIVKDIEIGKDFNVKIDGRFWNDKTIIAANDGLTTSDLVFWFKKRPFSGQILIWNNINLPY